MALTFQRGAESLIHDLEKRGFRIEGVSHDLDAPNRAMQVCLRNGVVVNWDADSQRVWADGPYPLTEKVESALRKQLRKTRRVRTRTKQRALMATLIFLTLAALATIVWLRLPWDAARPRAVDPSTRAPEATLEMGLGG